MAAKTKKYKAIIIGTGQAGNPLAKALASAGWKTAVIESDHVGGTCVNYGCTPTKTMVASARVAHLVSRAGEYGIEIPSYSTKLETVVARKNEIVNSFRQGGQTGLEKTPNLDLIFGFARFVGSHQVEIEKNSGEKVLLNGEFIIINSGAKPLIPDISGLKEIDYLDSSTVMDLEEIPKHLVVIGGGYIGLEFGQMFRRFGSKVTIIQRGSQLLSREDEDVAETVATILEGEGIKVLLNSQVTAVKKTSNDQLDISVSMDGRPCQIKGSHLLVAVGRIPASADLQLDLAGISRDSRGFVKVDDTLETDVPGVYAIGDVKGGPAFTHISYDDYRILRDFFLQGTKRTTKERIVPYTVFIDPQLGRVGLTEKEAKAKGVKYRLAKLPMTYVARALESAETRGFMKALIDEESGLILGCAILGIEGGEIMSVIQVAMMGNLHYTSIKEGIFAHPTLSESLNNLFMAMDR
ncbi:MAG: mercuric reductase [Calditrichia bacterium]|nr:mercuric reductase [Calditrichia bacterium]